ncbi:MAG TPA: integrin alpha, partial [Phycisphaerae bacterium]
LIITYDRVLPGGGLGCYPDLLSNNLATAVPPGEPLTIPADSVYEAQGFATIIHSNNRDNSGVINPLRLADTVVWLELVGQQPIVLPPASAFITQLAGVMGGTHIEGARFQSGWYDNVDASQLNQPPMNDLFGWNVASIGDITNDQLDEIIVSAPRNERDLQDTIMSFGAAATHVVSRGFTGSIVILAGHNYDVPLWQDTDGDNAQVPILQLGSCQQPLARNVTGTPATPADSFQIFAENVDDFLALGQTAGDFQLDGVPDILCTAKFNGYSGLTHSGAAYVIYERSPIGDVHLNLADNPASRPPMLRIRGEKDGDQIGFSASTGQDVNGDRIPDVFISSPAADFGPVPRPNCAAGVDLNMANFQACRDSFGSEVFDDDPCKQYDFNNDRMIDDDDLAVLNCLMGPNPSMCCPVDNGFVGVVFGGRFVDGDRTISQIGTTDLPGIKFYGAHALDRAGYSVSSAGDFNRDGFGDLLIAVPGEKRMDTNLRTRVGTAYLIFGGTHLTQGTYSLAQVGTADLPGIVFISPFVENRPNEAPIDSVGLLGDINNDGFDDIGLGITRADFIDQAFPQDPNVPGTNPNIGRRPDDGNIYIVYGNNIGTNRAR